jgi:uncharacterized protein (DUF2225 family)
MSDFVQCPSCEAVFPADELGEVDFSESDADPNFIAFAAEHFASCPSCGMSAHEDSFEDVEPGDVMY